MKKRIFIGLLACLLALPQGALAAGVMNTGERAETPLGEEAAVWLPEAAVPRADGPARLADGGHTAADHAAWTALSAAGTLNTGSYYLSGDVTGQLVIAANATVDLCLSGHTLDAAGAGSAITVSAGATLNLHDCAGDGKVTGGQARIGGGVNVNGTQAATSTLNLYGGSIEGNSADNGGGVRVSNGTVTMYGGSISNNVASSNAGGVMVTGGSFVMEAGSVSRNSAKSGGGVYAAAKASLEILGGTITENTASSGGGGVLVYGTSTLTMSAGAITNNRADGSGGGVRVENGSFALSGGSISDNTSVGDGGGILLSAAGTLSLSGSPTVSGNQKTDNSANNICPTVGEIISVDGTLTTGTAPMGISMSTPGAFTAAGYSAQSAHFVSDNTDYAVGADNEGRLFLGGSLTYHVPAGATGTVPAPTVYPLGERVTLDKTFPLRKDGYQQFAWTGAVNTITAKLVVTMDQNVTVYPVFARGFAATEKDEHVLLTYGAAMSELDLNDYVRLIDSASGAEPSFGFALAKGQTLPDGLRLDTKTGKVTGTPKTNPGSYAVTFTVTDRNFAVTLFSLEPSQAYRTGELTLTFDIAPGVSSVTLGTPQWSGGRTTIALTPTPADLLTGARVLAARYDQSGAMTDLAVGTLSGNTLTFQGKQISINSNWKVFFLSGSNYAPLCETAEVR